MHYSIIYGIVFLLKKIDHKSYRFKHQIFTSSSVRFFRIPFGILPPIPCDFPLRNQPSDSNFSNCRVVNVYLTISGKAYNLSHDSVVLDIRVL